jgi:hypothetical protein
MNSWGAVFFGSVYWRLGRWRKLAQDIQSDGRSGD